MNRQDEIGYNYTHSKWVIYKDGKKYLADWASLDGIELDHKSEDDAIKVKEYLEGPKNFEFGNIPHAQKNLS